MKKALLILSITATLFSCTGQTKKAAETETINFNSANTADVKDKSFDELFKKIDPTDISDNVFKLVGKDYTVITAGTDSLFNSMTASWGGWGQLFEKPSTWCFLNASRYTLELMKKEQTYTMSYFPEQFREQVLAFGQRSGRDSDKMKETTLTSVKTPDGNISYKEAKLIIECKLFEITSVNPNDFYTEESKKFLKDAYKDAKGYHKIVFGTITNVWVKK